MKHYIIIINNVAVLKFQHIEDAQQALYKLHSYNTGVEIQLTTRIY